MPGPLAYAAGVALVAAGKALLKKAAQSPAVRKAVGNAAKKSAKEFSRAASKAKQVCKGAWRKVRGRSIKTDPKQLQSKYKHAGDFGVNGNYNPANAAKFKTAIEEHVASSANSVIKGTYHGQPVTHYVNPQTRLNVIKGANGEFISGWKLSPSQLGHVLKSGKL